MQAHEYIQRQVQSMRRLTDAALQGLTDEQVNWVPPGQANPVRAALLHLVAAEDRYFQTILRGQPMLWEAGGWSERVGLPYPPSAGRGWDEVKTTPVTLASVQAYAQAVRAATESYLAALTDEELDRTVQFFGGDRPAADVIATFVAHTVGHAGEIAALRGVQGVKGLPF